MRRWPSRAGAGSGRSGRASPVAASGGSARSARSARAGFPREIAERALRHDPEEAEALVARAEAGLMSRRASPFLRAAVLAGARRSIPMQVGVVPFALVVGIVGQGQGLSLLEITLMSALCYAGSAQLLALGHWAVPAPVVGARRRRRSSSTCDSR